MVRIIRVITAILACGLSACDSEDANGTLEGRSISVVQIRYVGEKSIEEKRLRTFISIEPGHRFTPAAIDSDIKSLYESGLVDDVRFLAEADGDLVRVIAEISTRSPFGPQFCIGNTAFSDKRLADATGLTKDQPITVESIEIALNRLKDFYVDRGYADAEVECRAFNGGNPTPEDFIFVVTEGSPAHQPAPKTEEVQQGSAPPP